MSAPPDRTAAVAAGCRSNHVGKDSFCARPDVEHMQGLVESRGLRFRVIFLRIGHQVHGIGRGIDHWSTGDSDLGAYVLATNVITRYRSDSGERTEGLQKIGLPKLAAAVHIESVNLIVFGRDQHDIMTASADVELGYVQGLSVNLALHRESREPAKCCGDTLPG